MTGPNLGSAEAAAAAAPPRRSILRDASQYTGATYLTQVGSFITGLVTKGLLGPANVGIWSLLNILLGYFALVQVGTLDAMAKEVPYLRQRGDGRAAQRLGNAMTGFVLLGSTVVALAVIAVTVWRARGFRGPFLAGVLLLGLSFPLWMAVNMQMVSFRAAKRFDVLSRQLLLQLAITAVVGIPLIWRWSIYGQYAAFLVSFVLFFFYFRRAAAREPLARFTPVLDREATQRLLSIGLPLQLSALVFTLQTTLDSLLAARALGVTMLGYYSLAVTVKTYVYQTPNAFSVVMFPRFQERFAASSDDPRALRDYVEKPIIAFAFLILPLLVGASWQIVPFLVRHFLHAFVPAISAIKLLLIGTFFASLWHMPSQFLIAINKLWQGVLLSAGNAALVFVAVSAALALHPSVEGVAVGTSVAYAVASLVTIGYAVKHFRSASEVARLLLGTVLAAGFVFGLLLLADQLIPTVDVFGTDLIHLLLRSVLLLVFVSPLFWWADRRLGLVSLVKARFVKT